MNEIRRAELFRLECLKAACANGGEFIRVANDTNALLVRWREEDVARPADVWAQYRKDMTALLEGFRQTIADSTAAINRLTAAVSALAPKAEPERGKDFSTLADWDGTTAGKSGTGEVVGEVITIAGQPFQLVKAKEPPRTCGECKKWDTLTGVLREGFRWCGNVPMLAHNIAPDKCFQPREATP